MKYKQRRSVEQINKDISGKLLDTLRLLEILEEMIDCSAKEELLVTIAKRNVELAFKDIEKCRVMISVVD